jgi:hypothetical protein
MRKPIGITVPHREVGYKEPKGWRGIADSEIIEILRDYNMEQSPNRMNYTKEIIRTLMERNT